MISYRKVVTTATTTDLFDGNSPTGKWVVLVDVSSSGGGYLSFDGTTQGMELQTSRGTGFFNPYRFVVENQPLYMITPSATAIVLNVTILPYVEGDVSIGICSSC